jgi:HEAT repeat protein
MSTYSRTLTRVLKAILDRNEPDTDAGAACSTQVADAFRALRIRTVKDLVTKLRRLPVGIRSHAICALGTAGVRSAVKGLVAHLEQDTDCYVEYPLAISSLANDRQLIQIANRIPQAQGPWVQSALLRTLMMAKFSQETAKELLHIEHRMASDESLPQSVQSDAIEAIALTAVCLDRRSRDFRQTAELVLRLLLNPHPEVRASAAYAAGVLKIAAGIRILRRLRRTDHEFVFGSTWMTVASEATRSLRNFGPDASRSK